MSDDVVSHIKGLISFMKSVDELFKSISSELIKELNTPICCAADLNTIYELFYYTRRMDILSHINMIMPKLCELASKNKDPELQSILLQYPYISMYINELYINPNTTTFDVSFPGSNKNECKDVLIEKIRGIAALVLGKSLLSVKDFESCLDIALHPRRFVKVTDDKLRMAVIKLLSAVFNGYCCAINVNWKETPDVIENHMREIIKTIKNELNTISQSNNKRIRREDDVIVELNNVIKKFDCDIITTAQRTAFKRHHEEGEMVNKAIDYLSKREKHFYSKNVKVFESDGQEWIAIPKSRLSQTSQDFFDSLRQPSESDNENSIDDLLEDSS